MDFPRNVPNFDDDILLLIIKLLGAKHRSTVLSLAKSSKRFYALALPELCRSITLTYPSTPSTRQRNTYHILSDPNHQVTKLVREIIISGDTWSPNTVIGRKLERVLERISQLTSFRWETPNDVPQGVISYIETKWPTCKLHVNIPRNQAFDLDWLLGNEASPDLSIGKFICARHFVTSPLLSTLTYKISWRGSDQTPPALVHSEILFLGTLLSASQNLDILNLGISPGPASHKWFQKAVKPQPFDREEASRDPLQQFFRYPKDFQLPQLRKIVHPMKKRRISNDVDEVDVLTWTLLRDLPRWNLSSVKHLELHGLSPYLPFDQLEGRVPNLRSLDVILVLSGLDNLMGALSFISMSDQLEELSIQNRTSNVDHLWDWILLERSSKNAIFKFGLTTLPVLGVVHGESARPERKPHPLLEAHHVEQLLHCPKLRHLEIDISVDDAEPFMSFAYGPEVQMEVQFRPLIPRALVLSRFTNLLTLALTVEIPEGETRFLHEIGNVESRGYAFAARLTRLHEEQALATAVGMFRKIFLNDSSLLLRALELKFVTLNYDEGSEVWRTWKRSVRVWRVLENGDEFFDDDEVDRFTGKGRNFGPSWTRDDAKERLFEGLRLKYYCDGKGWEMVYDV